MRGFALMLLTLAVAAGGPSGTSRPEEEHESPPPIHYAGNAFGQDCARDGIEPYGRAQFFAGCSLRAPSPDGKWMFVQTGSREGEDDYRIYVENSKGHVVGDVPGLNDAMPYVLAWSSRADWFAVSHHVGSFMDRPEIYEITPNGVIRRDEFARVAAEEARRRYPCMPDVSSLQNEWLAGWMYDWSRDGRKIAWRFTTRLDICLPRSYTGPILPEWQWDPFIMISDVESGEIVPGSLRVLTDDNDPAFNSLPIDGPYAEF